MHAFRRYLVITEKFPPKKGGSNTTFDEVYRRIGDRNTHIVTADQPGAKEFDADHPNTIHRLQLDRHSWLRPESLAIYGKLLLKSLQLTRNLHFDEIHAGRVLSEGLVGLITARLRRLPVMIYAHGEEITTWRTFLKFRAMVFTFKRADRILANSTFTKKKLIDIGVRKEKIAVVFPGVDVNQFHPGLETSDLKKTLGLNGAEKLILSVGRLSRRKGFDKIIQALPVLLERGIDIHHAVIGIGPDKDHLISLSRDLGIFERVHLLGNVSDEDLPRWYNAADVFAMPNHDVNGDTEGFGKVYVEAAACGKPSIAGITGGTGDAVLDGITGLRVDGSKVEEVAKGLYLILTDSDYARKLGKKGYRRAHSMFSWEESARKTAAVLNESRKAVS